MDKEENSEISNNELDNSTSKSTVVAVSQDSVQTYDFVLTFDFLDLFFFSSISF